MKKTYRVWDAVNDFETIVTATEEDIKKFARYIDDLFGGSDIYYKDVEACENTLYKAYADYLVKDGFAKDCEKEIKMLEIIDKFVNL
jgi:hypothetical protein